MKVLNIIILTAFLFSLSGCREDCECDLTKPYFDVIGIDANHHFQNKEENNEVNANDYIGVRVESQVNYIAYDHSCSTIPFSFSLISSATACDCPQNGQNGSKNESYEKIEIITLHDFDSTHLSGDTISDLFLYDRKPLSDFDKEAFGTIKTRFLDLKLSQQPTINSTLKFAVYISLSTGEAYRDTTSLLTLTR